MKKFFALAALVLSSVGAFAQYSAGDFTLQPKVGLNCTSITGNDADYKAGFVGGIEAEYHFSPLFGLSGGLLYSMQGAKWSGDLSIDDTNIANAKETLKTDYLNIPILANIYVAKGLALKAGVQPGFNLTHKAKAEGNVGGYKGDTGYQTVDGVKSFDFSIPVGISYEYMNVCLDARYNIGCTKIFDEGDGNHSVFQLTLGYKFKL